MMKRRLVLLLGTFLLLLLAFATYSLFNPTIAGFNPEAQAKRRPMERRGNQAGPGKVRGVTIYDRSPDGRLRGVYKVKSWTQEDDGSYFLEEPAAMAIMNDGSRIYMIAESGRVWAEEVSGGFNVRQGRLDDSVQIWIDQSKDPDRKHPAERTHRQVLNDCIRITTRNIRFNRDMLEIGTDEQITLWSKTVDILGKGLTIQWNESPRELRRLEIERGYAMVVKNLPEQMDMIQLPTKKEAPAGEGVGLTAATTKPAGEATSKPAADAWALESKPKAKPKPAPTSRPAAGPGDVELTDRLTGIKAKALAIATVGEVEPEPRNVYKASFKDNVRIFAGNRRLEGADVLDLTFEWDRAWRSNKDKDQSSDQATTAAASQPAPESQGRRARRGPGGEGGGAGAEGRPQPADADLLGRPAGPDGDRAPAGAGPEALQGRGLGQEGRAQRRERPDRLLDVLLRESRARGDLHGHEGPPDAAGAGPRRGGRHAGADDLQPRQGQGVPDRRGLDHAL